MVARRHAVVLLAAAALLGCEAEHPVWAPEGDGVEIGGAPSIALGCERYCNFSVSAGCPPAPDSCIETCQTLFRGTCEQKLADLLLCDAFGLSPTCLAGQSEGCRQAKEELFQCQFCGNGGGRLVGERGCESNYACGFVAQCDDDGFCICQVGDQEIGTCRAIVGGLDACMPATSCCAAFL